MATRAGLGGEAAAAGQILTAKPPPVQAGAERSSERTGIAALHRTQRPHKEARERRGKGEIRKGKAELKVKEVDVGPGKGSGS